MILRNLRNRKKIKGITFFVEGVESVVNSGVKAEATYAIGQQHYGHSTFRKGNRTYLAYMQRDESPYWMMPTVTYWDHVTKTWAEPVELIVLQSGTADYHPIPVIMLDNDGYIYVAVERLHNSFFYIHKSQNPYDISTWNFSHGVTSEGHNAYPLIYHNPDNNYLFLIGRRSYNYTSIYRSTNGGGTWTLVANVGQIGSTTEERSYSFKPLGVQNSKKELHFFVARRIAGEIYTDIFYCKCSMDTPHLISNYSGSFTKDVSVSILTLAEYRANYSVLASGSDAVDLGLPKFFCISPNGILFYPFLDPNNGGRTTIRTRNSDNTAWVSKVMEENEGTTFQPRSVISYDDNKYDMWMHDFTPGTFQRWRTLDCGDTWTKLEEWTQGTSSTTQFTSNFNDDFDEGVLLILNKETSNLYGYIQSIEYTK